MARQIPSHIIVFGNEKGGTGKSTLAVHVIIDLLRQGHSIGLIDLDSRQQSITRYLQNRARLIEKRGYDLPQPEHVAIAPTNNTPADLQNPEQRDLLESALNRFSSHKDFIVLDCPGSHTYLARLAHALADTLITPLNDSFIDMDLLGQIDPDTWEVGRLSHYAEMVWESRKFRSVSEKPALDWVVTRNRLATLRSQNNLRVDAALDNLQERLLFRYVPGLYERVIYRELFPLGLTMMDLDKVTEYGRMQVSHVAARNEVRSLVRALNLPISKKENLAIASSQN